MLLQGPEVDELAADGAAAAAAFEENDKGSIEPGKLADFTVLSNDIMKIAPPEILKTRSVMTVIGGEIVSAATD